MFRRLAHVCIGATDLAETERFYVDLLGMDLAIEFKRAGRRIGFCPYAADNTFIEVFAEEDDVNAERPLIRHFCLEAEDMDSAIAALRRQGVDSSENKSGADGAWQAWITDPGGSPVELN